MKYARIIFSPPMIFLLLCFLGSINELPAAEGEKSLQREFDPVVVTGDQCLDLIGKPLSVYGLYASKAGKLAPIPFQIDEVADDGRLVLTHGSGKSRDQLDGFDANDQLVFMAKDTGDKIYRQQDLPPTATGCVEIAVFDPIAGGTGWVYLMSFAQPPALAAADYVRYDPGQMKIFALNYITGFDKRFPVAAREYAFTKSFGGDETDIIDRVKIRLTMKQFITIKKTEEDIAVTEEGYLDGPVRVVVRTVNKVNLFMGIPASKTKQDTFYYYGYADFPFVVDPLITPDFFQITIIDDFADCKGWTFYSSNNPQGHLIDGKMDASDRRVDLSYWEWSVVSSKDLAFWSRCIYPPNCPVRARLYYNDDMNLKDKMEDVPGELPGTGYNFIEGWEKVAAFPVEFRLVHFYTKAYFPGSEDAIVNLHDHPVKISVSLGP